MNMTYFFVPGGRCSKDFNDFLAWLLEPKLAYAILMLHPVGYNQEV